jgi:general secretion pathway protein F
MNRYRYQATNASGDKIAAEMDATSVSEALAELEKQGLAVASIEIIPPEKVAADAELATFYEELRKLLSQREVWLPRIQAMIAELPRGITRRRLEQQLATVSNIDTPHAFIEHRDAIGLLPLIASKSQHDSTLQSQSEWLRDSSTLLESRARYFNAFVYPAVLFLVAVAAFFVLSIFVFHEVFSFFDDFRVKIPKTTSIPLWLADQLRHHTMRSLGWLLLGSLVAVVAIRWWRHFAWTNTLFGRLVAGRTSNLLAMSSLIGTLAVLLEIKSPLGLALSMAGRQCKHAYYRRATDELASHTRSGCVAEFPRHAKKRLPPLLLYALQPKTSDSPHLPLLHELAAIYRDRARQRRDWVVAGGPSLATFVVGLFILWLAVGLLTPMSMMINALSH